MSAEGNNKSYGRTEISLLENDMAIKASESTWTDKMVNFSAAQDNPSTPDRANSEHNTEIKAECREIFKEMSRDNEERLKKSHNRKDNSDVYNEISVINSVRQSEGKQSETKFKTRPKTNKEN